MNNAAPHLEGDRRARVARDLLALGSWVFYLLIVGRAMIVPYRPFTDQLIIAGALLLAAGLLWRGWDGYLGRALVLAVCVIVFYESWVLTLFVIGALVALVPAAVHLGRGMRQVVEGLVVGAVCAVLGLALGNQTRQWVLPEMGRGPAHIEPL